MSYRKKLRLFFRKKLRLKVVDDGFEFPKHANPAELLAADCGRYELIRENTRQASEWRAGTTFRTAGTHISDSWSDNPTIPSRAVYMGHIRDAYYLPGYGAIVSSSGKVPRSSVDEAMYFTPDLAGLPRAWKTKDGILLALPLRVPRLDAVIVTMPWGATFNYGHFLLDCLAGIASLTKVSELSRYTFVFPVLMAWQRRHLELLGIRWRELDQLIYRCRKVIFSSCMRHFLHTPNDNYRVLRDIQLTKISPVSVESRRIYLSRAGGRRIFLSQKKLEQELSTRGFSIVRPELLSVDEQINLFRQVDVVVSCFGAGLSNTIYCRPGARIVEIQPVRIQEGGGWVGNICAIMGLHWRPYFCGANSEPLPIIAGKPMSEGGFSFDVDLADLLGFIDGVVDEAASAPPC